MGKHRVTYRIASVALVLAGCATPGTVDESRDRAALITLINQTCFEVVVPRLEPTQLQYERDLPWEQLPFHIRNDEFTSIGTAFAVAPDRFVTAAHVFSFETSSLLYTEYFIRDTAGGVYPVTDLLRFHNEKDFVEFTVEGFRAPAHLEFRSEPYITNETVYQVGNIYGQGIVAVPGTVLGSWAEPRNGAWNLIKSSPPNDRGSSGGPLIDENMQVLGVLALKDDNFSYSIPVAEIVATPERKGFLDQELVYGFNLLIGERSDPFPFTWEFELPIGIEAVKSRIKADHSAHYDRNMTALFSDVGGLFPDGEGALEALHDSASSVGIQVVYRNEDDKTWYFSSLDKDRGSMGDGGHVDYATISGTTYFDLQQPDGTSLKELTASPKSLMDTLLRGITFNREFAGDEIRVTSFGDPVRTTTYLDRYDRKWYVNVWNIDYSDQVCIMMWLPLPGGASGLLRFPSTAALDAWLYDLEVIANLAYVPYTASLAEWDDYLQHPDSADGPYAGMRLVYQEDGELAVASEEFSLQFDSSFLEVQDDTMMMLARDFYLNDDRAVWGLRKIILSESRRDNYIVSYKFLPPAEALPEDYHAEWDDLRNDRHPYNAAAYAIEGRTGIGTKHPQSSGDRVLSLYLGFEGDHPQAVMEERLEVFKGALVWK